MEKRTKTDFVIVHHSATDRDTTTFESIKRWHMEHNGWDNIGYHRVIEGDGSVHSGMPINMVGYHCLYDEFNYKSVAVCLTGNFQDEYPSEAQLESLEEILAEWETKYGISKEGILGHRETGAATSCPGNNLVSWLENYRGEKTYMELDSDVSTEIEDKYGLKNLSWYSKYWTGHEFIQGALEYIEKLSGERKSLKKELSKCLESGVEYEKRIKALLEDKEPLEANLGACVDDNIKLVGTITDLDKKFEDFEKKYVKEVKELADQRDECQDTITEQREEFEKTIKDLEDRVLNLQKPERSKDMNRITKLWENLPKTIKVFCFLALSTLLSELAIELGVLSQTFLVRISAQLINLLLVGLEQGVPEIKARLSK